MISRRGNKSFRDPGKSGRDAIISQAKHPPMTAIKVMTSASM